MILKSIQYGESMAGLAELNLRIGEGGGGKMSKEIIEEIKEIQDYVDGYEIVEHPPIEVRMLKTLLSSLEKAEKYRDVFADIIEKRDKQLEESRVTLEKEKERADREMVSVNKLSSANQELEERIKKLVEEIKRLKEEINHLEEMTREVNSSPSHFDKSYRNHE